MGLCPTKIEDKHLKVGFGQHNNPDRPSNVISTTKYSLITFIPHALILQFTRAANFVYILSAVLQSIKLISSLSPVTAIGPLIFVLSVSLIRQAYQDYKRHKKDKQVNQRVTEKLIQGEFKQITWENVHPGDIIKVKNTEAIPCDMVLLYTTEENSICYVETSNLDGQTNLKTKYAFNEGISLYPHEFQKLEGFLEIDLPKSQLYQFNGKIKLSNQQQKTLVYQNILLRQTHLKNTHQIVGIAVYCGTDTKIMMNKGHVEHKVTKIQRKVNIIQVFLLITLMCLCIVCSVGYYLTHKQTGRSNMFYLKNINTSLQIQSLIIFFSCFLLLNFLIPISLNVLLEFVKGFLSLFLGFDNKFKDQFCPDGIHTSNMSIIEQLGMINYVLTDKTGTLTSNNMVFKSCCIKNKVYSDQQLKKDIQKFYQNPAFHNFWTSVIICHDVIKDSLTNKYQGSSPDQVCFVEYARKLGYEFSKKTKNYIQLIIKGQKIVYELLYVIPFTMRKRMTVIVRAVSSNNEILMFTKGADSAIFEKSIIFKHQSFFQQSIDDYAKKGLRTLVFSFRKLSQEQFLQIISADNNLIAQKFAKIKSQQQIDCLEKQLIQQCQSNLKILGATAIQDKLQDKVPETISRLQQAEISIMMITGDKLETAQNIGYLSNLINKDFKIIKIKSNDQNIQDIVKQNLFDLGEDSSTKIGVIIEGGAIRKIVEEENPLMIKVYAQFLKKCTSVIFCRSSPREKALVVKFVKKKLKGIVLAIGDGGNDTGMIEAANVGVGILGREGNSAASASDFYFGQFKHLDRLLLHHGRWFYMRISYFFVYYGWKNLMMSIMMFLYLLRCAYSGYPGFSEVFIVSYNMLIGIYIIGYYGIWAQDVNVDVHPNIWKKLPLLYKRAKQVNLFSFKRYIIWTFLGVLITVFLDFYINLTIGSSDSTISWHGYPITYEQIYITKSISLVIITLTVIIMDLKSFSCFTILIALGIFTFGFIALVYLIQNLLYLGRGYKTLSLIIQPKIYFVLFVIFGVTIGLKTVINMVEIQFFPTEVDKILKQKHYKKSLSKSKSKNRKVNPKQIILALESKQSLPDKQQKKKDIKEQNKDNDKKLIKQQQQRQLQQSELKSKNPLYQLQSQSIMMSEQILKTNIQTQNKQNQSFQKKQISFFKNSFVSNEYEQWT